MLNREDLIEQLKKIIPEIEISEGSQYPEVIVPPHSLFELAKQMKEQDNLSFDYLINHTAVDFLTHMSLVYHFESTQYRHLVVIKIKLTDREQLVADSLSELYPTAEFFEREVFDLFGVRYNNHPNLKRFFLEDDYGYPLRKDFRDEINIIER